MKVTVKDCLQMQTFNQSIVVAGERNLNNRVRSVSVMDASNANEAVICNGKKEELVLTTFSAMKDDVNSQCSTIRELAMQGIAGIIFLQRDTKGESHNYNELIATAEEAGIPFILLPETVEVSYASIIEEIMEKVLYGNNFNNALINNTIFHLLNFEKYTSFQQALKEAALNNAFQVVLLSEELNPVFVIETRKTTTIDAAIRRGRETAMNLGHVYSLVEIDGVQTYWGSVGIAGEKYYLIIVDNEDSYSSGEITKLAEIIELAMGMWKFTPERDAKSEFVKSLVRDNKSLAYSLRDEIELKSEDILSVFYGRGINDASCEAVIDQYEEKGLLKVLKINEDNDVYGVVIKGTVHESEENGDEKAVCIKLFDELKEKKNVRIYHVTGFDGIEGAGDGFRMINETWAFAGHIFPYKRVFTKYELALVASCVNLQNQGGYLKKNYTDLLTNFRKEGDNKSRQLLETLETFVLDAGLNSGKTAEFMGIHTNTVQYRLKKINEILGAEITGNRVIPGLTIALALQRVETALK